LRFFITLVVEQNEIDLSKPKQNYGILTLPNLETKFVAANTLIGVKKKKAGDFVNTLFTDPEIENTKEALHSIRKEHFYAKTAGAKKRLREKDTILRNKLTVLLKENNEFAPEDAIQFSKWNPYDQNSSSPFFDLEWMFGLEKGFDVVIGNPPYIQIQKFDKETKAQWASQDYETYIANGDVYVLFYEKGFKFLNEKGILTYITSNSWMRTKYGKLLRRFFRYKTNPISLINFEDVQIFQSAIVESNILIGQKSNFNYEFKAANFNGEFVKSNSFYALFIANHIKLDDIDEKEWTISTPQVYRLKKNLEKDSILLGDLNLKINIGINTGLNEVFIVNEELKDELIKQSTKNSDLFVPILRGRDISKYKSSFSKNWLINAHNGVKDKKYRGSDVNKKWILKPIDIEKDYPSVFAYLKNDETRLKKRYDQGWHWTNLRNCAYILDFKKPKIIWGELSNKPKFTYDDEMYFSNNTTLIMSGNNLKYILAILNSKLAEWFFNQIMTTSGMGTNRWLKYKIQQLPVKDLSNNIKLMTPFEIKVNQILALKKEDKETTQLENEIDIMVYKLYNLTCQEVFIIDPSFSLTQEEYDNYQIE